MADVKKEKGLLYTDDDIQLFKDFYATNEHCYAEQLPPNENNKARWNKVEGPDVDFDKALIAHLEGDRTIGAYVIIIEGEHKECCKYCTFDFDLSITDRKEMTAIDDEVKRGEAFNAAIADLENKVRDFIVFLHGIGIDNDMMLVSFSGYKGFHVDIFFDTPMPAKVIYDFANMLKAHGKLPSKLEVFPKQPSASGAYGSLVKLPLGVHKLTNKRAKFVDLFDSDASSFGTPFDYLRRTKKLSLDDIHEVIDKLSDSQLPNSGYSSPDDEELRDLSQPPTNASLSKMLNGCVALKRLIAKASKDHHLLHEERLALLTLCIYFGESGAAKIHEIISNCSDYDKDETEKIIRHARDQKKYKPITCARMQEHHICAKNCSEITSRGGLSPIKLAYNKAKVDLKLDMIEDIEKSQAIGKTISVPFKADSLVGGSYSVPKEVVFKCSEGCPARTGEKIACDFNNKSGETKYTVSENGEDLMDIIGIPKALNKKILMHCARIPCCKPAYLLMDVKSQHHVQAMMMTSADEVIRNTLLKSRFSIESRTYYGYFVGDNINVSTDYIGIGKVHPHPKDQKTTYLISKVERMMGNLDEFNPTPEQIDQLKAYKALDKEVLIRALSDTVTGIHGRYREALAVMLTIFSALQLEFNGRMLDRGWMETCFVGDSSQGKSKLPELLLKFLGVYNMVSGGSTSVAGLIGGVGNHDSHQFISWGVLPNSDKTIIFLDEMEQLQKNIAALGALREIRSSGRAVITKIRKGSKLCRVRMVASANPKGGLSMDTYKRGCQAITQIMEGPDARRFDIFQFFFTDEVSADVAMQEVTDNAITVDQAMLRTAVLWAWTRGAEDIKFTTEVTRAVLNKAKLLIKKYRAASVTLPLITMDIHEKMARITAASAQLHARTEDFIKVTPTLEDVEIAYAILEGTYSSDLVALDEEALECERRHSVPPDWLAYFKRQMQKHQIPDSISIIEVVAHINTLDKVRADEAALYLRTSRSEISKLLQLLAVENLLEADYGGTYKPTTKMHKLAKMLRAKLSGSVEGDMFKQQAQKSTLEDTVNAIFG